MFFIKTYLLETLKKSTSLKSILFGHRDFPLIKAIVYPKLKILASFSHHSFVPNLFEFLLSVERKIHYFDFHSVHFFLIWKSMITFVLRVQLCVQFQGLKQFEGE